MIAAVMALIDTCGRRHQCFEELFELQDIIERVALLPA
jgi:hypothetical protein